METSSNTMQFTRGRRLLDMTACCGKRSSAIVLGLSFGCAMVLLLTGPYLAICSISQPAVPCIASTPPAPAVLDMDAATKQFSTFLKKQAHISDYGKSLAHNLAYLYTSQRLPNLDLCALDKLDVLMAMRTKRTYSQMLVQGDNVIFEGNEGWSEYDAEGSFKDAVGKKVHDVLEERLI
ncbi:hypothetical protein EK21DRAFT_111192 [Setomelanomma holmii]|uniref:Uncharacterized protein n=1 Tax=Setomelanomma holmii TaxID=210430 RepID=A0A9P4HAQ4_9PLEO|nr:hypothetical protein EK21DRAFT_111192 [Setomelanomma holmii]